MKNKDVSLELTFMADKNQKPQRRRLWRWWNQLSRLQRNLVSVLFMLILITGVYFWNQSEEEYLKKIASNFNHPTSAPRNLFSELDLEESDNKVVLLDKKNIFKEADLKDNDNFGLNEDIKQMVAPSEGRALKKPVQFAPPGNERQVAVVEAFQHAWTGYKKYAWGHDHLKPISQSHNDWFGLGLSIIDGIDTMYIMGLKDEFAEAQEWIMNHLTFNEFHDVNLFEVTIRVLGGLLSIFHLSGDKMFLDKAVDLGERLMPCFTKSPSPIPFSDVNLASHTAHSPRWGPDSSTSEVTTLQLEFRDLSYSSKDPKFEEAAFKVSKYVNTLPKVDGLVPIFINPNTGQFHSNTDIKIGARGDSYYEYLLKQWIQTGKKIDFLKEDYLKAIKGIQNRLLRRSSKNNLLFIGELKGPSKEFVPKMDHLVCYLPGTLALGVLHGLPVEHQTLAEELLETCYRMYSERPTFLAPEITFFSIKGIGNPDQDMYVKSNDAHNLLRPEFLESLWYMYQINGNTTYQDWGWTIFQAFQKYTRVKDGYTSIGNVNNPDSVRPRDMMESFFLSETLKYLYLLFANDRKLLDLTKWVVNSEAHPLPILSL